MAAIPKVCLYRAFCGQKTERYWDLSSGSSHLTALEQKNLDYTDDSCSSLGVSGLVDVEAGLCLHLLRSDQVRCHQVTV